MVDGDNVLHRAEVAWRSRGLVDRYGRNSGPKVGFLRMVGSMCERIRRDLGGLDSLVVAFDAPSSERRGGRYKASRQGDLRISGDKAVVANLLHASGVWVVAQRGWEADDICASVAAQASCAHRVVIASADRDMVPLVGDHVSWMDLRRGVRGARLVGPGHVEEEFGVPPERYVLLAALRGDVSDELNGVPGLGPKKAAQVANALCRWNPDWSDDELIERAGRYGELVCAHRDLVEENLQLMATRRDLNVGVAPWGVPSHGAVQDALSRFSMGSLCAGVPQQLSGRRGPSGTGVT